VELAIQQDFWSDGEFDKVLRGGHLSAMADCAARRVLGAWEANDADALERAMALLRDVLPADPPEDFDPSTYIGAHKWVFARTMPENPHEYVLIRRSTDWREHLRFLRWIRVWGDNELYRGVNYRYRTIGEWRYWALGPNDTIINRRRAP
jgi:hypothetical protein